VLLRRLFSVTACTVVLLVAAAAGAQDSMNFETTIDFAINEKAALEGTAGGVEVRGVEFASSFAKGGMFGSADPELRSQITARLECATSAATKQKLEIVIEFLDGEGGLIDRVKDGANLKNETKVVEIKLTTLKWVVPRIAQAKISVRAKG
jgi:pectate lyase